MQRQYIEGPSRPLFRMKRDCQCGVIFLATYYRSKTRGGEPCWRPYTRCGACRRKSSLDWYYRNTERAKAATRRYKLAHPYDASRWYGCKAALNHYRKLRFAGVERDVARSEALAVWQAHRLVVDA
jgi:hypothetical protein